MSSKYIEIISITPAGTGWWAKFTEDNYSWYEPVALWALCSREEEQVTTKTILPCFSSVCGIDPTDQDCELLYMPDAKMKRSEDSEDSFAWHLVE